MLSTPTTLWLNIDFRSETGRLSRLVGKSTITKKLSIQTSLPACIVISTVEYMLSLFETKRDTAQESSGIQQCIHRNNLALMNTVIHRHPNEV